MPEEINRLVTDRLADLLLHAVSRCRREPVDEGVEPEKIVFVGNVMVDTLLHGLPRARQELMREQLGVREKEYAVVTIHRPSNVDDPAAPHGCDERVGARCPSDAGDLSSAPAHASSAHATRPRSTRRCAVARSATLPRHARPDSPAARVGDHRLWRVAGRNDGARDSVFDGPREYRATDNGDRGNEHDSPRIRRSLLASRSIRDRTDAPDVLRAGMARPPSGLPERSSVGDDAVLVRAPARSLATHGEDAHEKAREDSLKAQRCQRNAWDDPA